MRSSTATQRIIVRCVLAASLGVRLAHAGAAQGTEEVQDPPTAVESTPRVERSYRAPLALWYGVALGATWVPFAIWSGCRGVECTTLLIGPTLRLGFAFGPPIVHWNRGRVGHGFLSLGGQIAAVAIGAGTGSALSHDPKCPDTPDSSCPARVGPLLGWLVADAVWAAIDVVVTPATINVSEPPRGAIVPTFNVTSAGGALGMAGSF